MERETAPSGKSSLVHLSHEGKQEVLQDGQDEDGGRSAGQQDEDGEREADQSGDEVQVQEADEYETLCSPPREGS